MNFADLTSPAVGALAADPPVLLLPLGAIEPHGPHAPLNTDLLISTGVCERVAARVPVRVLPPIPYGVTRMSAAFPGAVGVEEDVLHDLIVQVCASLAAQGFPHVVIVNNHFEPGQVAAVRRAVRTLAERGVRTGHLDLTRRAVAQRLTEEFRTGSCHAGRYETSLVLADRPDLVDAEAMAGLPENHVDMPARMRAGAEDFPAMGMDRAYCGAPAEASAAEGESTFDTLAELLLETIAELVTEE
ncbi:creatininase family protein [Actinokineospora sp. UTMC 2448]|uniref:creatininase family protein n=1 Tax=Actinokineospora sp. UTMC 2448 TaxID=2268449 RepID=UPI0021640C15|nr:creatininase family protein [Actinokineospora sp. UTMC 2448]UVS78353.1 Creatinine amidohydrolase [Actinokineospora sp. UTMC 2448]